MRTAFLSFFFLLATFSFAQKTPDLNLSKIYQEYNFHPEKIREMHSMADGEHYSMLSRNNSICEYEYKSGRMTRVLLDGTTLPDTILSISDHTLNSDESKILITTNVNEIYRHSFEAKYWIYDIETKTTRQLAHGRQQLATFSPDGKKIAYVFQNNLYYKDLLTDSVFQVTQDGDINRIINGAPDWVYEEEFGFARAYAWSNDSKSLAFYRFDESGVKQFDMMVYQELYPSVSSFKYPKAGESNSVVSVHVYHTDSKEIATMETGTETDQYIVRIKWSAAHGKLSVIRLNRLQNKVDILLCDAFSGQSTIVYHDENPKYLSRIGDDYIHFLSDQKHFVIMSERSGYYHYYLYKTDGTMVNPITSGNYEVIEMLGIDEKSNTMYFTCNESSVINQDICSVRLDGKGKKRISLIEGTNSPDFSSNYKYFVNKWSDANTPPQYTVNSNDGKVLRVLENNSILISEMKRFGFTKKQFIKIPVSSDLELNAYIIKPQDFDSTKKYPLLIHVYGGPQSQEVVNAWDQDLPWHELLASKGIVVACIDNRGTDGRGEAFRKSTYLQLGKFETQDQISAARYLGSKTWIDENRIGIWGWSYGGYMSLLCMTLGADVFKTGIAVAPVTNWRYYDNIYTERFMRRPNDNPSGYDEYSPVNLADKLKGKLLLIHGMADDNVHLQNSVAMAERLIQANKQFEQFMYPNKNHNINGGNTRYHLFTLMTDFLLENL